MGILCIDLTARGIAKIHHSNLIILQERHRPKPLAATLRFETIRDILEKIPRMVASGQKTEVSPEVNAQIMLGTQKTPRQPCRS
jgi:hypothetical protein